MSVDKNRRPEILADRGRLGINQGRVASPSMSTGYSSLSRKSSTGGTMEYNDFLIGYAETQARMAMEMYLQGRKRIEALESERKEVVAEAKRRIADRDEKIEQLSACHGNAVSAGMMKDQRIRELEAEIDALVDYKKSWLHEVAKNERLRMDYANLIKKASFPISFADSNTADAAKCASSEAANG